MEFQTTIDDVGDSPNWVSPGEMLKLRKASKKTRNSIRNELILLMLYRHGLRETELCRLLLSFLDFERSQIHIKRIKGGNSFTHPVPGDEMRHIKRYLAIRKGKNNAFSPYLFLSEQGTQLHRKSIIKMVERCSELAGMRKITPHMLRHGCGYYLANKGYDLRTIQDYLGHKNVQNTVIYTRLSGKQFIGMWE